MNSVIEEFISYLEDIDIEAFPGGWHGIATALASIFVSCRLVNYGHYKYRLMQTKRKIEDRKAKTYAGRISEQGLVSEEPEERSITELEFKELHAQLHDGSLRAWDVLIAFQNKALQTNELTNCVVDFLEIQTQILRLDDLVPEQRGPLHGIPISVSESVNIKGYDSTLGFAKYIGQEEKENSVLLQVLLEQGAIPFVRTNVSQGQSSYECSNPIFGTTMNPQNEQRTSGGASGGEGALIGGGGSILGIGCDLGGSIRIPAHCCGAAGLMCTPTRLSNKGTRSSRPGINTLSDVYSPIGRDVDAIIQFMKAVLVPRLYELDPLIPRIPWNDQMFSSETPLTIGYYVNDGAIQPIPAVERAVEDAKARLEELGHKVVNFTPPDVPIVFERMFLSVLDGDKRQHLTDTLKGDLVDKTIQEFLTRDQCSWTSLAKSFFSRCFTRSHPIVKRLKEYEAPGNIGEWWDRNEEIEAYKRRFVKSMKDAGIDCILCPTLPIPAWPLNGDLASATVTYTSLYNVLGFPAGAVPTTEISHEDVRQMGEYPRVTDLDKFIHKVCKDSEGLPISVQCVGLPFQEEHVLRLMKTLQDATRAANYAKQIAQTPSPVKKSPKVDSLKKTATNIGERVQDDAVKILTDELVTMAVEDADRKMADEASQKANGAPNNGAPFDAGNAAATNESDGDEYASIGSENKPAPDAQISDKLNDEQKNEPEDDQALENKVQDDQALENKVQDDQALENKVQDDQALENKAQDDQALEKQAKDDQALEKNVQDDQALEKRVKYDQALENKAQNDQALENKAQNGHNGHNGLSTSDSEEDQSEAETDSIEGAPLLTS